MVGAANKSDSSELVRVSPAFWLAMAARAADTRPAVGVQLYFGAGILTLATFSDGGSLASLPLALG